MRAILAAIVLTVLPGLALAQPAPLYEARAIVTGTDLRQRPDGFAHCLLDVLAKLTGNPAVRDDPRAQDVAVQADTLIEDFAYADRMADKPVMDEQGSRDRPYTLTCRFVPSKIDAAMARIGLHPWRGSRPRLLGLVTMTERSGDSYALRADTVKGDRPRNAFLDAADRMGMRLTLPTDGAPPPDGLVPLEGTLRWSEPDLGWVADWSLTWRERQYHWRIAGVSYDEAFRKGIDSAAEIMSGNATRMPVR